jgi:hypothetical protein
MFNLLFRFWPRKSVGTPNASAPAAREVVLRKSRRSKREVETNSTEFNWGVFLDGLLMGNSIHGPGGMLSISRPIWHCRRIKLEVARAFCKKSVLWKHPAS